MNKLLFYLLISFAIFLFANGVKTHGGDGSNGSSNISLIVLGRSGSGISSTVRTLLGNNNKAIWRSNETNQTLLKTYNIPLTNGGYFKIIDVKGLVDGVSIEQDVQILSTLKSYLVDSSENPASIFFLVISKFDDSRFHMKNSIFTKMFLRIETLQEEMYGNTTQNTALVLTRLMSETASVQRRPQNKIDQFRSAIRDFTSFSADSIEIVVGENLNEGYNLVVENGQTKLPNKQLYPQNVFDAFLKIALSLNNTAATGALTEFMNNNRNNKKEIISTPYLKTNSLISDSYNSFLKKLHLSDSNINETQLCKQLSSAFDIDSLNSTTKSTAILSFIQLQQHLQSNGLNTLSDLPNNTFDKIKFFRTVPNDKFQLDLLSTVFNLTTPAEFMLNPLVGYGFDITRDKNLLTTPLVESNLMPIPISYFLLPDFIHCSKVDPTTQVDFAFYNETLAQYIQTRMKLLVGLESKVNETIGTVKNFGGNFKPGFNLKPQKPETLFSLTTLSEFRTVKCELQYENINLNEEFQKTVNELGSFDSSDRDVVSRWQRFFNTYGTHVVSLGYGGGRILGSLQGPYLTEVSKSEEEVFETLSNMVNFNNFTAQNAPNYTIDGGLKDILPDGNYFLNPQLRTIFVTVWKQSLKYDPIMLDNELSLIPISKFAQNVNSNVGDEMEKCLKLLISGNLIYIRKPMSQSTVSSNHEISTVSPVSHISKLSTLKAADYSENTVGQGYNLLTGIVLPTSPFELGDVVNKNISHIDPDNFNRLSNNLKSCFIKDKLKMKQLVYAKILSTPLVYVDVTRHFNSESEYILHRIRKWSGNYWDIVEVPKGFVDEIPTWINIQNKSQIIQPQFMIGHLHLREETSLSKELLDHVRNLYFKSVRPWPCSVKKAWKEFFNTYGTHYIKSADIGQLEIMLTNETSKCPGKEMYCCNQGITVLKSTFVLEKISLLLYKYQNFKIELDEAYYQLLKNNLDVDC